MRICIIGAGQMGRYYTGILIRKLGFPATNIMVYDIDQEKSRVLANDYSVHMMTAPQAKADAAIVATNTPSHADVIGQLADAGVPYILCEKPLGFTPKDVQRIWDVSKNAHVLTALVINFSGTLPFLRRLMEREGLFPLELYGNWGKPRPLDKIARPSAGDVEDESIHPIAFALALIPGLLTKMSVSARTGHLPFVDPVTQKRACELDRSFPLQPNHSTSVRLKVGTPEGDVPVDVRSSFLLAKQTRQVGGILGDLRSGLPKYAFEIEFDKNNADVLTLADFGKKYDSKQRFPVDKLTELTKAFVGSVRSGNIDARLTRIEDASTLVDISDAILRSGRKKGEPVWIRL